MHITCFPLYFNFHRIGLSLYRLPASPTSPDSAPVLFPYEKFCAFSCQKTAHTIRNRSEVFMAMQVQNVNFQTEAACKCSQKMEDKSYIEVLWEEWHTELFEERPQLTTWNLVLPVNLTVIQLVKKFTTFCRTRRFINVFVSSLH
jgi:hypothetical protein